MRIELSGGRENAVFKEGNFIIRPSSPYTKEIHSLLKSLHEEGFDKVPYPFSLNEKEEKLSYVDGIVYNEKIPKELESDETLKSVAILLRSYHDSTLKYVAGLTNQVEWMLTCDGPVEVMCHGDFAPYNLTIKENRAVGIIDFDTVHPGSRLWDMAYALYRWVPLMSSSNPENFGTNEEKLRRVQLFLDKYNYRPYELKEVFEEVIKRIEALINYMRKEAEEDNITIKENIESGHLSQYLEDLDYIRELMKG